MEHQLNITDLDFDSIKNSLIAYYKNSNTPYSDWDYEGSALNTVIDVLSANTHFNAMLAHMTLNESFLHTAQIRSNVVSGAKQLGYTPRSSVASIANVNITIAANSSITTPDSIILDRGTVFTTTYLDKSYQFVNLEGIDLTKDSGNYVTSSPAKLQQGRIVKRLFKSDSYNEDAKYVIDDLNIDVSTLIVRSYPDSNQTSGEIYSRHTESKNVDANSLVYFINENAFGKYEVSFGNGVFGKKPYHNGLVEVEYLSTLGSECNGSHAPFTLSGGLSNYILSVTQNPKVVTLVAKVTGGADRETIDEIKQNATYGFITQNRAVTSDDYKNIIYKEFPYAKSVNVWGGEDNVPPQYGKVFICVKPHSTTLDSLSSEDKTAILNILKPKKVLSIIPEIVDAQYIRLVLDVLVKYNSNLLTISKSQLESNIKTKLIADYNDLLGSFDSVFRHSNFMSKIDSFNRAIVNSHVRVYTAQTFNIGTLGVPIKVSYGTSLTVDDSKAIIDIKTSDTWMIDGEITYLGDKATSDANVRKLYTYSLSNGVVQNEYDVGVLNLSSGIVNFDSTLVSDTPIECTLILNPTSNDIAPKRNQIIHIDTNYSTVAAHNDVIAVGGSSRASDYETFKKDR